MTILRVFVKTCEYWDIWSEFSNKFAYFSTLAKTANFDIFQTLGYFKIFVHLESNHNVCKPLIIEYFRKTIKFQNFGLKLKITQIFSKNLQILIFLHNKTKFWR